MRSEEEIISKIGKLGDERLKIASKELKACYGDMIHILRWVLGED